MITPRITRLLRVPDLRAMHRATAECCRSENPLEARSCAVILPTRGAAASFRRTLEHLHLGTGSQRAIVLPDLLTRADLYVRLHQALPDAPPLLSEFEREVIFRRAARDAEASGAPAPFHVRLGLIPEILAFYDELRRQNQAVADFDRLMTGALEPAADADRGAERMLRQTRFLSVAFAEFERRVARSERLDEHGLRDVLISGGYTAPYRRIVVTVADQAADARGLWNADFDLLSRMPGLESLDLIATENLLATGFHERVHDLLPGIEEARIADASTPPRLVCPSPPEGTAASGRLWFGSRDREQELADFLRANKSAPVLDRIGVVYQRPLPYLYLAHEVFADAQVPFQAVDALPLAAEPIAASLDLLFAFVLAEGTRAPLVEMLTSPHWSFPPLDDRRNPEAIVGRQREVSAVDALLREVKYVGGWDSLGSLAAHSADPAAWSGPRGSRWQRAAPALQAGVRAADELRAALAAKTASGQVRALIAFIKAHERPAHAADPWFERHARGRAAILSALQSLADAHARHDDEPLSVVELTSAVRRWIEGQTFAPYSGTEGVLLLDAAAAAYADVDELRVLGLVESDWPDARRRSIFYPASLLVPLGWPGEADRTAAARARFHDLLRLPHARISASRFTLEDDAIVSASPFLEELELCGLVMEPAIASPARRVFMHEALSQSPIAVWPLAEPAAAWASLRASRTPHDHGMFHGQAGARAAGSYAVSHVERYLDCPFKYFAAHVLRLEEERDDESGLTPQERGQLVHEVFEEFFRRWHASGRRAITIDNLADAHDLFRDVADERLAELPEGDAAVERTHLLGSAVAPGMAGRAFSVEIEHDVGVLERLLEHQLEGAFEFQGEDGPRLLQIRAKADRIDLLTDGTLRVVDYKLSRAPKSARALQLPIYGVCAAQHLEGRHGRSWTVARAGYVAFKEKNPFVSLGTSTSLEQALVEGQQRLIRAVDDIERGRFAADPDEPFFCTRCGYATVCRKDYVGDEIA